MNANPGTLWQYHSGGVIAVGGMIRRAVGGDFYKFARDNLFVPIGVTSRGYTHRSVVWSAPGGAAGAGGRSACRAGSSEDGCGVA